MLLMCHIASRLNIPSRRPIHPPSYDPVHALVVSYINVGLAPYYLIGLLSKFINSKSYGM